MRGPHRDEQLTVVGPPIGEGRLVVVGVHGRDQEPTDVRTYLVERIADPSITWLLPAAAGRSWYPGGFQEPIEANEPWFSSALGRLVHLEAMVAGLEPRSIVWAGFSQGACLVCEHLAQRPRRWGGALVFTGGRAGPPSTDLSIAGDLDGLPMYFGSGDHDPWVPVERFRDTVAGFQAAGAQVVVDEFADDGEHHIRDAEIERARCLIAQVTA